VPPTDEDGQRVVLVLRELARQVPQGALTLQVVPVHQEVHSEDGFQHLQVLPEACQVLPALAHRGRDAVSGLQEPLDVGDGLKQGLGVFHGHLERLVGVRRPPALPVHQQRRRCSDDGRPELPGHGQRGGEAEDTLQQGRRGRGRETVGGSQAAVPLLLPRKHDGEGAEQSILAFLSVEGAED